MTTYSITEDPVDPLGKPAGTRETYTNTGNLYDVAIGSLPFFLAASDKYPYHRETAAYKRQQLDLTQQPGEQTFEGWWLRSQSSFHLGAGIRFLEPLEGDNMIYRFDKSAGVDVWTPGKVSMLPDVTKIKTISDDICMIGGIDGSDTSVVFMSDDDQLYRITAAGSYGSVTYGGSGSDISSLTTDGTNYYAANATGIYKGLLTGVGSGSKVWDTGSSKTVINWVKQRLMAAIDNKIYELAGTGPTLPTAIYTHPNSAWTWTSIAEGPNAIYLSGFAGTSSAIYKISLGDTGTLPTLASAVTAADFPYGEHVTGIATYLGKYMLIGTNKGVRVGIIDSSGFLAYGPLTYEHEDNNHTFGFAFQDRFAYATVTNAIDGDSGLIRIDLSQEVESGKYAWANDLNSGGTGLCNAIANIGETGRVAFTVEGQGLFFEHATDKVASGYLQTGAIRYNTFEKKHFKTVKALVDSPFYGSVTVSTVVKGGTPSSIITLGDAATADQELAVNVSAPQEQLAFHFTFNRSTTNHAQAPVLVGYRVKALPAVKRARSISLPLMCYDFEQDRNNIVVGYEGRAAARIAELEALESNGDTVMVQDFTNGNGQDFIMGNGEQVTGLIEKVTFDRVSSPDRRFQGFGGIIYVTVRTT